jgi:peptidoglycan/LPS O-acetylase OafA/YrhL
MNRSSIQEGAEGRLRELDGWRAISVLLVIVHHVFSWQHPEVFSSHGRLFHLFRYCGPLGVKVFFVISGFVICRLLLQEEKRYGNVSLGAFYIRRAFRILPPLYFYLAIILLLTSLGLVVSPLPTMLSSALFLQDLRIWVPHDWFVGHTWSLATEEQFYLVFPTLWIISRKISRVPFFLILFSLVVAWNVSDAISSWDPIMGFAARPGFACICFGVIMAILEPQARAIAKRVPMVTVISLMLVLLWSPMEGAPLSTALYDTLFVPPAIGIVLMFSLERKGWLRSLLCSSPLQAIGVTSYGAYLWQELFTALPRDLSVAAKPLSFLLPLLLVIVPLSWRFIEKPAMQLGKRLSKRLRARLPAEAAPSATEEAFA